MKWFPLFTASQAQILLNSYAPYTWYERYARDEASICSMNAMLHVYGPYAMGRIIRYTYVYVHRTYLHVSADIEAAAKHTIIIN